MNSSTANPYRRHRHPADPERGSPYPAALCDALGFVYSRHLRNQATLGGELACQQQDSPLLPVLLVLEAVVVLENNLLQPIDAYLAGQRNALVLGIVLPEPELRCATRRISRNADGLAVMTAAVALDSIGEMRVAVAGVTPQPMRLRIWSAANCTMPRWRPP